MLLGRSEGRAFFSVSIEVKQPPDFRKGNQFSFGEILSGIGERNKNPLE